jgi:hypothetical protein
MLTDYKLADKLPSRIRVHVQHVFALAGAGMLLGSVFLYKATNSFLAEAIKAPGTVFELVESRSSDGTTYRPIVRFKSQNGQTVTFEASTSSPLLSHAEINDFFSLWGMPAILGVLGAGFFSAGGGLILTSTLRRRKNAYLQQNGRRHPLRMQLSGKIPRRPSCMSSGAMTPGSISRIISRARQLLF